jgi:plastocyanin
VRTRPVLIAALAGAALVFAAPAQAGTPKPKTVRIYDNYYLKSSLTVKKGTMVIWRWPGFDAAGDVHDVKLKSGPHGVKKFHSEAAATDYSFRRKLKVPGKYKIVCTLHEEMKMTIRVKH